MKDRKNSARGSKVKTASTPQAPAKLGRDIQAEIGQQLRAMYGGVVDQGVPDRFLDLLDKIDKSGGGADDDSGKS